MPSRCEDPGRAACTRTTRSPRTLVLRVEGPVALEIQHLSGVIIERVNRFFGWRAVGTCSSGRRRSARKARKPQPALDPRSDRAHGGRHDRYRGR